ncbi:MAG: sel1 repeat family protein [Bacteroidales bacterium]|nr:sel1 repeat family protein [Bacteroidales bacterium]
MRQPAITILIFLGLLIGNFSLHAQTEKSSSTNNIKTKYIVDRESRPEFENEFPGYITVIKYNDTGDKWCEENWKTRKIYIPIDSSAFTNYYKTKKLSPKFWELRRVDVKPITYAYPEYFEEELTYLKSKCKGYRPLSYYYKEDAYENNGEMIDDIYYEEIYKAGTTDLYKGLYSLPFYDENYCDSLQCDSIAKLYFQEEYKQSKYYLDSLRTIFPTLFNGKLVNTGIINGTPVIDGSHDNRYGIRFENHFINYRFMECPPLYMVNDIKVGKNVVALSLTYLPSDVLYFQYLPSPDLSNKIMYISQYKGIEGGFIIDNALRVNLEYGYNFNYLNIHCPGERTTYYPYYQTTGDRYEKEMWSQGDDKEEFEKWATLKMAEKGDIEAQVKMAQITKDTVQAIEWWIKAADQGNTEAQYNAGFAYLKGYGVEQDYKKAVRYLQLASHKNNPDAMYLLGHCYYYAKGVQHDKEMAVTLLKEAAKLNHQKAKEVLTDVGAGRRDYVEPIYIFKDNSLYTNSKFIDSYSWTPKKESQYKDPLLVYIDTINFNNHSYTIAGYTLTKDTLNIVQKVEILDNKRNVLASITSPTHIHGVKTSTFASDILFFQGQPSKDSRLIFLRSRIPSRDNLETCTIILLKDGKATVVFNQLIDYVSAKRAGSAFEVHYNNNRSKYMIEAKDGILYHFRK